MINSWQVIISTRQLVVESSVRSLEGSYEGFVALAWLHNIYELPLGLPCTERREPIEPYRRGGRRLIK